MNITKSAIVSMALAVGMAGSAHGITTNDCVWGAYSTYSWSGIWQDGNVARVTKMQGNSYWTCYNAPIRAYKLVFDLNDYNSSFWLVCNDQSGSYGHIEIGEGGVEFVKRAVFSMGYNSNWYSGLGLNGSQTWSGTASGDYADAILGTPAYYSSGTYSKMPVTFAPNDMTWTINRNLNIWYFSSSTEFGKTNIRNANIRVCAPAHFYLPQDFTQQHQSNPAVRGAPGILRAKKLTLSGDGADTFPVGRSVTLSQPLTGLLSSSIGLVTTLAPTNVATTLELNNGADLTATSPALFSITNLLVTGTGESALSGSFTFDMPENVNEPERTLSPVPVTSRFVMENSAGLVAVKSAPLFSSSKVATFVGANVVTMPMEVLESPVTHCGYVMLLPIGNVPSPSPEMVSFFAQRRAGAPFLVDSCVKSCAI